MSMVLVLISVTSATPSVRAVPLCDGDPVIEQVVAHYTPANALISTPALRAVRPCKAPDSAMGRLDAGRRAFYALDFKTADSELIAAARLATEVTAPLHEDVLTEAYALLVWSALEASAQAQARDYARALVQARPGVTLPGKVFPPHVVATVTKVSGERRDTGSLEVTSQPPGARLLVDGADRCVTPCVLHGVPSGVHHVVLRTTTGAAYGGDVEVRGATRVTGDLAIDPVDELVTALTAPDLGQAQRLRREAFGEVQRLSAITRDSGGGYTAWVVDEGAAELVTLRFAITATATDIERAIDARKPSALSSIKDQKPQQTERRLQIEVAVAGLLPISAPQRDAFSVGGLAALRLGLGNTARLQVALGGATFLGRGDQETASVGQLSLGGALALRWVRLEAHGGLALTGDVVRPWVDVLAGLSPERLPVAPALFYVRVFDGGGSAARPGDAQLMGVGLLVAL